VTLLAPDIVEAILDGRQPKMLELKTWLKPLPLRLDRQRRQLSRQWDPLLRLAKVGFFYLILNFCV
jgi:hypothetical protein